MINFLALAGLALFLWPYLGVIGYSLVVSVILYEIYKKRPGRPTAILLSALTTILFILLFYFLFNYAAAQISSLTEIYNSIDPQDTLNLTDIQAGPLRNFITSILFSIPGISARIVLFIFLIYYFLLDGPILAGYLFDMMPKQGREKLKKLLWHNLRTIILGVYLSLFLFMSYSFFILFFFKIPNSIFLTLVIGLFGVLPLFGGWLVYLYAIYIKLMAGEIVSAVVIGLLLLAWQPVDFWLRLKFRGKIHPAVFLISLTAGLSVFGFSGVVLGPIIVSFLMTIASMKEQSV
ncbi:MAG: AI-2E family transporter [Candidatus Altiarchaeota archaeon]|nr:AI-2E family transporter [Candidatus Altiarchaeota archaeon]